MFLLAKVWHEYDKYKTKKKELLVNTIIINAAAELDTTDSISDDGSLNVIDFNDDDGSELVQSSRSARSIGPRRSFTMSRKKNRTFDSLNFRTKSFELIFYK